MTDKNNPNEPKETKAGDTAIPHPNDPQVPRDFDPTHDKEFPHEETDITGQTEDLPHDVQTYESDMTDAQGRKVGERQTGEFIVPDDNNVTGEGWTVPERKGGGWTKARETSLEEQIDEPDGPGETNHV